MKTEKPKLKKTSENKALARPEKNQPDQPAYTPEELAASPWGRLVMFVNDSYSEWVPQSYQNQEIQEAIAPIHKTALVPIAFLTEYDNTVLRALSRAPGKSDGLRVLLISMIIQSCAVKSPIPIPTSDFTILQIKSSSCLPGNWRGRTRSDRTGRDRPGLSYDLQTWDSAHQSLDIFSTGANQVMGNWQTINHHGSAK